MKTISTPLIAALVAAFFCLSGCTWLQPQQSHICESATDRAKGYCYARTNLNDLITAANLSRADGTLSESSHDAFLDRAKEADRLLDTAEIVLSGGGNPQAEILAVKTILLELQ